jgi:uncharacterized protein YgiM (DUF1202 family)
MILAFSACATSPPPTPEFSYITPIVTYLRECPKPDCKEVAEVHKAEQVEVLAKQEGGWHMVRVLRSSQQGWIRSELLGPTPIVTENYYITANDVPLRDGPSPDSPVMKKLQQGDRVKKVDQNAQGWWRIMVETDNSLGWVPASMVSERFEKGKTEPTPGKSIHFVAAPNINLNALPLISSRVVKVLKLNDKMEILSHSGPKWCKVRELNGGTEGWIQARFLKDSPVTAEPPVTRKRSVKKTLRAEPKEEVPDQPEGIGPSAM